MLSSSKIKSDLIWNYASFLIIAISGLGFNIVVGYFYDESALGLFNLTIAIYILLSQLSVFGIHLSVLRYTSKFHYNFDICSEIINSAFFLTIFISGTVTITCIFSSRLLNYFFNMPGLVNSFYCILPGLFFFAINKTLLSAVNGLLFMRAFSIFQAARYILVFTALIIVSFRKIPEDHLTLSFSISEIILFLGLFTYLYIGKRVHYSYINSSWIKTHLSFGCKAFMSGTLTELNTRVDLLMLGLFNTSKLSIGVYSMALLICEGYTQLALVLRNILNPHITRFLEDKQTKELEYFIKTIKKRFYLVMILLAIIGAALYPMFVSLFFPEKSFINGYFSFIILLFLIAISSGYLPFNMILSQAGFPGSHTIFMLCTVISNIILNSFLIPQYGINGAAAATGVSFVLSAIYLHVLTYKTIHITI